MQNIKSLITRRAGSIQKSWANDARWKLTRREWAAEDVAKHQGSDEPVCDNSMPNKLWDKLQHAKKNGLCEYTFGALDTVQVTQMAKYLDTVYVSGWQTSSTNASNHMPGPDIADYPYDSVPKLVDRLRRAQEFHDRKQMIEAADSDEDIQLVDYLNPIVADADTGHGGPSAVTKLTKMFIEAGAAGIHIEDQRAGAKKCGHMAGKVLCSTREQISRLKVARFQADTMNSNLLIVARTDAKDAIYIDNDIDPVDQAFIDKDAPRSPEGYHTIDNGLPLAIARANEFAPYCDIMWCEMDTASLENAKTFADGVLSEHPDQLLALNCSPSFNWSTSGLSVDEMSTYMTEIGKMGYAWSFITLAGFHCNGLAIDLFARDFKERQMAAYVEGIQNKERTEGVELLTHQKWSGAGLVDSLLTSALGDGFATSIGGEKSTENQFK